MDLGDFIIFAYAPLLVVPFTLAYATLKRLGWPNARLFVDAWTIFVAFLITAIVSLFVLAILTNLSGVYWQLPDFVWISLNYICTFFLGSLSSLLILKKRSEQENLEANFLTSDSQKSTKEMSVVKTSMITGFVLVGTIAITHLILYGAFSIYDYYYPAKPEFGIYDI